MIEKLTFLQRGQTILLGNTGLGLLNGLIYLQNSYAALSFTHCEIRMKIDTGPSEFGQKFI
jgi:hypothetical protein